MDKAPNLTNFHVEYMDVVQHWSPNSEKFAGADSLLTLLYDGWQMNRTVKRREHWFAGMRSVYIYHIELERNGEKVTMPVVHNPYINRMIRSNNITVEEVK